MKSPEDIAKEIVDEMPTFQSPYSVLVKDIARAIQAEGAKAFYSKGVKDAAAIASEHWRFILEEQIMDLLLPEQAEGDGE